MRVAWIVAALAVAVAGCDKNCQNSCQKIFDATECGLNPGGQSEEDWEQSCMEECEAALENAGSMGVYDPYVGDRTDQPDELTNERTAAAWMECVADVECADLERGVCHPINGFGL
jgi:hypothetical protein